MGDPTEQLSLNEMFFKIFKGALIEVEKERPMAPKKATVAEVNYHDGPIMLPVKMGIPEAIEVLQRRMIYDEEVVVINETINAFPWDGAIAMAKAMKELFGFPMQEPTPGFFGKSPPALISVDISTTETVKVPWGRFTLPGVDGWIQTGISKNNDGHLVFVLMAQVKNKEKKKINHLIERTREIAAHESIYRNKAIKIKFRNEEDKLMDLPNISFIDTDKPLSVIFSNHIEHAIESNVLVPVRYSERSRKAGVPMKRGVLLAGKYGTGKTLAAGILAREAVKSNWTFVYVSDVDELSEALQFAKRFQPAIVFAEDVERAAGTERNDSVNELLNTLDGIGSKSIEIMTVLTSNHPDDINPAMRRPGRIDTVIHVEAPDREASERLIRLYGDSEIGDSEDLSLVSEKISGQIPAVIREVVERSKLEAIGRTHGLSSSITAVDLNNAADTLMLEQKLFISTKETRDAKQMRRLHEVVDRLGSRIGDGVKAAMNGYSSTWEPSE